MPGTREPFANLIEAIYGAGLQPETWPLAIERVRESMNWTNAVLATPELNPARGGFIFSRQVGAADLAEYQQFSPQCVWTDAWNRAGRPESRVVTHEMIAAAPAFSRTSVFHAYFKPRDMHRLAGVILTDGTDGRMPKIGLHLSIGEKATMRRSWQAPLQKLIPHFRRALEMNRLLGVERAVANAAATLLERSGTAVAVLNTQRKIVYASPRAEALFGRHDGVGAHDGRLVAQGADAQAALDGLIERTVERGTAEGLDAGGTVQVPRPGIGGWLRVTALPVPLDTAPHLGIGDPAAIVLMQGAEDRAQAAHEAVARRYRLTPTEREVLGLLVNGASPQGISGHMGIAIKTVRMHLANLFSKTGARRQADLVRIALSAPAGPDWTS